MGSIVEKDVGKTLSGEEEWTRELAEHCDY